MTDATNAKQRLTLATPPSTLIKSQEPGCVRSEARRLGHPAPAERPSAPLPLSDLPSGRCLRPGRADAMGRNVSRRPGRPVRSSVNYQSLTRFSCL